MIKTFLYSMFAVFLFALGGAGSWFYLQMVEADGQEKDSVSFQPVAPHTGLEALTSDINPSNNIEMPVPVHVKPVSAEEIFRFGAINKKNIEQLRNQEQRLEKDKLRLKTAHIDIETRQREIEGMLIQVNDKLATAEKLLDDIKVAAERLTTEKQDVSKKLDELQQSEEDLNAGENVNVQMVASWIQNMKAEQAAEIIREMANDGKMDFGLKLLAQIEDRNVAKILAAMRDPILVAELAERLLSVNKPLTKTR